ncbi:imm11 family protein [Melittangium boletus]|uniref:imm11 family protein n=1 Tax=Melittangium boletus TaxID=83453 RepID=UPI003DA6A428
MSQRFFRLADDVQAPHRWHLGTPLDEQGREVHDWDFKRGAPVVEEGRLKTPIEVPGRPLDFCEAGIRIPVVHLRVATLLAEQAPHDVQLIPTDIEGQSDRYRILVVTRRVRCIDEAASEVSFWKPEHGVPEKVGQYMGVDCLRIDKARVGAAQVFRPEGWEVALIVSEEIKDALERMGATGTRFEEV